MKKPIFNPIFLAQRVKKEIVLKQQTFLESEDNLRVMSFNIRWDSELDTPPENSWERRKSYVSSMIRFHRMDLVGLQESSKDQVHDLEKLMPEYGWYGVGLEDGKDKGPFDAIFFRKSRLELLNHSHFFLSSTPDVPSKGWNARFARGVVWAEFKDKKSQKTFFFFNTHFDYHSQIARDESALLLRKQVEEITRGGSFVITGDFNIFPELGGKITYELLTQKSPLTTGRKFFDAHYKALFPHHGPTGSWSGFKEPGQPGIKPDYIFVDKSVTVVTHGILADTFNGHFPSDHLPVVAEIDL